MASPGQYAELLLKRLPTVLLERRKALGLSGYALAARAGVTREMVRLIERGECNPTFTMLLRIIAALGMTLDDLARHLGSQKPSC